MMILVLLKEHKERLANALLVCSIADDIAWFEIYLGEKKKIEKKRKKGRSHFWTPAEKGRTLLPDKYFSNKSGGNNDDYSNDSKANILLSL